MVNSITVVAVDDSEGELYSLECLFEDLIEYNVIYFTKPEEAADYIFKNKDRIHVLVSDYDMPPTTGDELVRKLRENNPSTAYLIRTDRPRVFREKLEAQGFPCIGKEASADELETAIKNVLNANRPEGNYRRAA